MSRWARASTGGDADVNVLSQTCCCWCLPLLAVILEWKNTTKVSVVCLGALSFGELFQVNIGRCGSCAADSRCRVCSVGDSKGTFHFACLIEQVQLIKALAVPC